MGCKTLRIGVFFDGTGNSRDDKEAQSNVAKLYDLYRELDDEPCIRRSCRLTSRKLYAVGVGKGKKTGSYIGDGHKEEGTVELATGAGGGRRIYEMIDRVAKLLDAHPHGDRKTEFKKREIDLFGFSRGAAEARDFVNTFIKELVNVFPKYKDVRFNFIGLFDTVASFGIAGNAVDRKPRRGFHETVDEGSGFLAGALKYTLTGSDELEHTEGEVHHKELFATKEEALKKAEALRKSWSEVVVLPYYPPNPSAPPIFPSGYQVIAKDRAEMVYESYNFHLHTVQSSGAMHLTAHHEVRKNFPLFDTEGGARQIVLLGVHSDIGGGYEPKDRESLLLPLHPATRKQTIEERAVYGWKYDFSMGQEVLRKERVVDNSLADASLFLMHEEALRHEVPLDPLDLRPKGVLYEYIRHLQEGKRAAEFEKKEHIVEYLAHQSATHHPMKLYPHPLRKAENASEALAGANIAHLHNERVVRAVYKNIPARAVLPKG